jgi:hypothetical protein
MTIYIVTRICDEEYGNTENVGVFASREEAERFLSENVQPFNNWTMGADETRPDMYIEEWEVGQTRLEIW